MYNRILLVVEANRNRHAAVDRAVATLALHRTDVQIRVLVLVNSDTTDTMAENPAMYRDRKWFNDLTRPLDLIRADYDIMVSWSTHFAASILYAARQFKASLIGVPLDDQVSDGELAMLRDPPCPVFFTRPGGSPVKRRCILVAIRPEIGEGGSVIVNQPLLEMAGRVADLHEAELHLIHAGRGADAPDNAQLAAATGLSENRVHHSDKNPEQAVRAACQQLKADLLVLGSRQRQASAALRGGLIDRLLGDLQIDFLVVP